MKKGIGKIWRKKTFSPPSWFQCCVLISLHPAISVSDVLWSCCKCGVCFALLSQCFQHPPPHNPYRISLRRALPTHCEISLYSGEWNRRLLLSILSAICNQRSQKVLTQLGKRAIEAVFPNDGYKNKDSLQCYDLSNHTILTMLNLPFHDCQVVTEPYTVRMFYYILTASYLPQ